MALTKIRGNTQVKPLSITDAEIASGASIHLDKIKDSSELVKRDGSVPFTGDINLGNHRIVSVGAPAQSTDAAPKSYVDGSIEEAKTEIEAGLNDVISAAKINDLFDVTITNPQDSQSLAYDAATNTWKNASTTVTSVNGKSGTVVLDFVDVGAAQAGHTHHEATPISAGFMSAADKTRLDNLNPAMSTLTDVSLSNLKANDVLLYDAQSNNWNNKPQENLVDGGNF